MTGREIIMYILENNLENEEFNNSSVFIDYITTGEAAIKFNVGYATIKAWIDEDKIHGAINVDGKIYIPRTTKDPRKE